MEGVNINEYINFKILRSDGYDRVSLFSALLLSLAIHGKLISLRQLEMECRYDVRMQTMLNGERPGYKTFERFINDSLKVSIGELMTKINLYIMDHTCISRDILYIDGTKYDAYANKMTFVWRKSTDKYFAGNWSKAINAIQELNKYFEGNHLDIKYTILKKPSFEYLLKITDKMEAYALQIKLPFVHGKGKRRTEFQRIYDKPAECAMKIFKYEIHSTCFAAATVSVKQIQMPHFCI